MNFNELATERKSIRRFIEKDVTNEAVTRMLEAAQAAPSAGNCQPWHFFVIRNKATIAEITEKACHQSFIATAPVVFVVCADIQRTIGRYGERGRNLYCLQDTAAAIQNILLCAADLGLGTCWCGAFDEQAVSAILNLDADMRPIAVIPVGCHDNTTPARKRRPIDDITTFIN